MSIRLSAGKPARILLILFSLLLFSGCSIRKIAVKKLGDALAESGATFASDNDPQLVKDASIHFAAWLFRKRRDPAGADAFKAEAEEFIATYIENQGELAFP